MPLSEDQLTPMFFTSELVTSTNLDSIITWSVALSSCSMMGRMRFICEGRSVMTRALLRPSTTSLPPLPASTSEVSVGMMSTARA